MLNFLIFEIRKNYFRKYMVIILAIFILVDIAIIYYNFVSGDKEFDYFMPYNNDTKNQWEFYKKMHEKLDGELTGSKIYFVIEEFNRLSDIVNKGIYSRKYEVDTYTGYVFGDYQMIKDYFYKPIKYSIMYEDSINKIVEKAKENIKFYTLHSNNFEKEKNRIIVNRYSGRKITMFYDMYVWDKLFKYHFSDFLILCLMLIGLIPVFVEERETKMDKIILSSQKGRKYMVLTKTLSMFMYIVFLIFVFGSINFLEFKFFYGLNGENMPLYSVETFKNTPLNCSVEAFYFLINVLKVVAMFSYGMIICFFSSICKNVIYPYMASVFVLALGIYSSGYSTSIENAKLYVALISPFTLLKSDKFYSDLFSCNILNTFFLRINICIVIQAIIIIFTFLLLCFFGTKTKY